MKLTKPAFLAAVSYLIMGLAVLFPLNQTMCTGKDREHYYMCDPFTMRVMTFIILLIPIILSVYSINCMMVGKCVVWSWVNAIAIVLWVLLFLIASSLSVRT